MAAKNKDQSWYQCKKCGESKQSGDYPLMRGCSEDIHHNWIELGTAGENSYQCKKCSVQVQTNTHPPLMGCPSGYSHIWEKF